MEPNVFFEKAKKLSALQAFGAVEEIDDFDDFDASEIEEPEKSVEVDDDFGADFDEDFDEVPETEIEQKEETKVEPRVDVVRIVPKVLEDSNGLSDVDNEIFDFLERHGEVCDRSLEVYRSWNDIYNDTLANNEDCYWKFFRVVYGVWFDSANTMDLALSKGLDFVKQIKMSRRLCQKSDVQFIEGVWKESWYDASVIDRYSNAVNFNPLLLELMERDKCNFDVMDKYVDNSVDLLCCIRLLLEDKFVLGEFNAAKEEERVVSYTEAKLSSNKDRFKSIRHRADFEEIVDLINRLESGGFIVNDETIEEFCNAFYLRVILKSAAHGSFNREFVEKYLLEDLGPLDVIAQIYEKGAVDLSLAENCNFFEAKIKSDARDYRLDYKKFEGHQSAFRVLVCSRYAGELNKEDYKRFLATITYSDSDVLSIVDQCESLIETFNSFWMKKLLDKLGLSEKLWVDKKIGENVVYVKYDTEHKKKRQNLQIDSFVLQPQEFLQLMEGAYDITLLPDGFGVMISNILITELPKIHYNLTLPGSLTTWAQGRVNLDVLKQFARFKPEIHANLLKAIAIADERFRLEREQIGVTDDDELYQVSASVVEFFKMDQMRYETYDKMFAFVADSSIFVHLLRSKNAKSLLMLFNNAFQYDTNAKMVYMFLFCIFKKYFNEKFTLLDANLDLIDNKPLIFLKGFDGKQVPYNIKTLIKSIDSMIDLASRAKRIDLGVTSGTIQLNFQ